MPGFLGLGASGGFKAGFWPPVASAAAHSLRRYNHIIGQIFYLSKDRTLTEIRVACTQDGLGRNAPSPTAPCPRNLNQRLQSLQCPAIKDAAFE